MENECVFSEDRVYRYVLVHRWDDMFNTKRAAWIGLNPSTADETRLDPTLRRIKAYSTMLGCNSFTMLNLFAFRSPYPEDLLGVDDPVGPENNRHIVEEARKADVVIAGWGTIGKLRQRAGSVLAMLAGIELHCLSINADGSPIHPLYTSYPKPGDSIVRRYDVSLKSAK